jgi:hypothetical protein
LNACDAQKVVEAVKGGGEYVLETDTEVVLKEEDLQIFTESKSGFISASDRGVTVALNTALTDELIIEGIERELVSKVQSMRKEADYQITDRISIYYIAEGKTKAALQAGAFAEDVLAVSVAEGANENADIVKELEHGFGVIGGGNRDNTQKFENKPGRQKVNHTGTNHEAHPPGGNGLNNDHVDHGNVIRHKKDRTGFRKILDPVNP